jgi:hypothetical protein
VIRYIPVLEKITTRNGKDKQITWKGRILNMPGYKIADASREVVENKLHARLETKTEE